MPEIVEHSALAEKVVAIIREAAELQPDHPITPETNFVTDLDIDSLTLIRIDALLQAKVNMALAADDIEDVETVGDLLKALAERGQPTAGA